jgi:hypothetical protein
MKRIILIAIFAFASLPLAASDQAAASATLAGEHLAASGPGIADACPTAGTTVAGTASGPYAGTFTETFSFTFLHEIEFGAFGPPGSLTANFEIASGNTTITGTKAATDVSGICEVGATQAPTTIFGGHAQGPYDAKIVTPQGVVSDNGSAVTDLNDSFTSPNVITFIFNETFASAPTSADRCKKGGWGDFPQFKNQGSCVRFVQTGKLLVRGHVLQGAPLEPAALLFQAFTGIHAGCETRPYDQGTKTPCTANRELSGVEATPSGPPSFRSISPISQLARAPS